MSAPAPSKLYSPTLLALSASLADYPLTPSLSQLAEGRSRTCGSTIRLGFATDISGAVTQVGMQVSACAVGQSSAAILARSVKGKTLQDLLAAMGAINRWLTANGEQPQWPEFEALLPAREHPGRHGALLMPWKAALEALSTPAPTG